MARPGSRLDYPRRKEVIHFVQTAASSGGEVVEMELEALPADGAAPPLHSHPLQEEEFEVLAGKLAYRIGDREGVAVAGERATVPARVAHTWWNGGDEALRMRGWVRPAMRFETFVETVYGLHGPGYADARGNADLVRMAVLMRELRDEWIPEFLPRPVRWLVLPVLALVGRLRGYRWWYPQFSPDGPVELPPGRSRRERPGSVAHEVLIAYAAPAIIASAAGLLTRQPDLMLAAPTSIAVSSALAALAVGLFYGGGKRRLGGWPRGAAAAALAIACAALAAVVVAGIAGLAGPGGHRLWIDGPLSGAIGGAIAGWRLHRRHPRAAAGAGSFSGVLGRVR